MYWRTAAQLPGELLVCALSHQKDAKPAAPPRRSDVTEQRTLFVRSVPFDMEEGELAEQFSAYGAINYAKIVKDRATGVSRGTAFIQVSVGSGVLKKNDVDGSVTVGFHLLV